MESSSDRKYTFGPVPSRRLGLSLGVDLIPRKVCTQDCVYCQVGRTTDCTIERGDFVPADEVVAEIARVLPQVPRPDYITMSGSGEPTLNVRLGEVIDAVRRVTDVPVAVITNGTLMTEADVRHDCAKADLVVPSLDAADEATFQAVNRPARGLTLSGLVNGLAAFRRQFRGQLWLEVFLIAGRNDSDEQVARMKALIERINPDRIDLNTATRPTADADVRPVAAERLAEIAAALGPKAKVVASFKAARTTEAMIVNEDQALAMIRRRPVTVEDIAAGLGAHANEVAKVVGHLLESGLVCRNDRGGRTYYEAAEKP
ncbi:MAG: radical SAM protein [Planctomycetes bacterium]|nr:radical SAM protein [Planctomycetota bacterium]